MILAQKAEAGYPALEMVVNILKKKEDLQGEEQVLRWVEQVKQGDRKAFDQIFHLYNRKIFNLALRILGDYDEAADQTQEIFVKLYQKIDQFQGRSKFFTWFYTMALNSCRNQLASSKNRRRMQQSMPEEEHQRDHLEKQVENQGNRPEEQTERKERSREVHMVLGRLDEPFREILIFRDLQGLSYDEIAEILQLSLGTVKSRISRAREMLRKEWIHFTRGQV